MAASNKTANYGLPLFEANDQFSFERDWNDTMTKIDTAIPQEGTSVAPSSFRWPTTFLKNSLNNKGEFTFTAETAGLHVFIVAFTGTAGNTECEVWLKDGKSGHTFGRCTQTVGLNGDKISFPVFLNAGDSAELVIVSENTETSTNISIYV